MSHEPNKNRYANKGNPVTLSDQWLQMNLAPHTKVCGVVIQAVDGFGFVDYPSGLSVPGACALCLCRVRALPLILSLCSCFQILPCFPSSFLLAKTPSDQTSCVLLFLGHVS